MLGPRIRIATNPANGYTVKTKSEVNMSGTVNGGRKAMLTNKKLYGDGSDGRDSFPQQIGRKGGKISRGGGFASNKVGPDGLTGRERARIAGIKGGQVSKRTNDYDIMDDYFPPNRFEQVRKLFKR